VRLRFSGVAVLAIVRFILAATSSTHLGGDGRCPFEVICGVVVGHFHAAMAQHRLCGFDTEFPLDPLRSGMSELVRMPGLDTVPTASSLDGMADP
jgi:hypothetical protein